MHFLNTAEALDEAPDYIKEIARMLAEKVWTSREREMQRFAIKAEAIGQGIIDFQHDMGRKEGIEKGLKKGEYRKSIEIAKDMLKDGVDKAVIQKYTRLSLSDLEKINSEMTNLSVN